MQSIIGETPPSDRRSGAATRGRPSVQAGAPSIREAPLSARTKRGDAPGDAPHARTGRLLRPLRLDRRSTVGAALLPVALLMLMTAPGDAATAQSAPVESEAPAQSEAQAETEGGIRHGKLIGARPTQYPDWFKQSFLNIEEDVDEARDAGRTALLFFHQDGCPYCSALIEQVFALDDIERDVRTHFDVIEMNMWGDREVFALEDKTFTEKTFAAAMRVQFTPTLVFLGDQGEPLLRLNGYLPATEFRAAIDFVKDAHYRRTSFREFLRGPQAVSDGGAMTAQPFFMRPPYILARGPGSKPLAVFFEQPDCDRCEALHDGPIAEDATLALLARFDVVQLDAWSDAPVITPEGRRTTARAWAEHLGVAYAPTIVYFDSDGTEVIRSEAFFKTFHTQSMMDYVLSGAWRDEPSFQRYISGRADRFMAQGIDVDIWR